MFHKKDSLAFEHGQVTTVGKRTKYAVVIKALLQTLCLLYISFSVPFRIAFVLEFEYEWKRYGIWWILDCVSDSILFLFNISEACFHNYEEEAITERKNFYHTERNKRALMFRQDKTDDQYYPSYKLKQNTNWYQIICYNSVAAFPFEFIKECYFSSEQKNSHVSILALCKSNRLLRLLEARRCMKTNFKILEEFFDIEIGPLRMWLMFLLMAVAAHWAACSFFLASRLDAVESRSWTRSRFDSTWGEIDGLWRSINTTATNTRNEKKIIFHVHVFHQYSRAYYWALVTMITTGFGDIVPITRTETIICIIAMYIGMSIACAAIANLTLLVMSANQYHASHRSKIDAVRQYATYRHLPEYTVRNMVNFIEHSWRELRGIDIEHFQLELSSSLRQHSTKFKLSYLLRRLPSLMHGLANDAFINALALKLNTSVYAPQDHIIRPGERLNGAILIAQGKIEVRSREKRAGNGYCCTTHDDRVKSNDKNTDTTITSTGWSSLQCNIEDLARSHSDCPEYNGTCDSENKRNAFAYSSSHARSQSNNVKLGNGFVRIDLLAKNDAYSATFLGPGDNFGLDSLFRVTISKYLVQAHAYCEIVWLLRSVFMTICREQCTPKQVEAMSNSLGQYQNKNYTEAKGVTNLRTIFYAGIGLQQINVSDLINARKCQFNRHNKQWLKLKYLDLQRKRIATELRKVMPSLGSRTNLIVPLSSSCSSDTNMYDHHTKEASACLNNTGDYLSNTITDKEVRTLEKQIIKYTMPLPGACKVTNYQQDKTMWWLFLRPGSGHRDTLEAMRLLLILFSAVTIPLALKTLYSPAFKTSNMHKYTKKEYLFLASYLCDAILIMDQVIRLTILPIQPNGILIVKGYQLRSYYYWRNSFRKKCLFIIELLSLFPWDIVALLKTWYSFDHFMLSSSYKLSLHASARILKVPFIVIRLPPQLQVVLNALPSIFSQQIQRIAVLNAAMLLACHWVGCLWVLIGRISVRHYNSKKYSWIFIDRDFHKYRHLNTTFGRTSYRDMIGMEYDPSRWSHDTCVSSIDRSWCTYIRAIYFAIVAMSTVGYGDIRPHSLNLIETIFTSCLILFGGLLLPSVVGGLASLMSDLNKGIREYRAKLTDMYASMQKQKFRSSLQCALLHYHDYVWTRQKGVDELAVLADLPTPMRRAVLNKTIGSAFSAAIFFSRKAGVEDVAREELVARLEPRIFLPGDIILAEADLSRLSMFLIERGCVHLFSAKAGLKSIDEARARLLRKLEIAQGQQDQEKLKIKRHSVFLNSFEKDSMSKDERGLPARILSSPKAQSHSYLAENQARRRQSSSVESSVDTSNSKGVSQMALDTTNELYTASYGKALSLSREALEICTLSPFRAETKPLPLLSTPTPKDSSTLYRTAKMKNNSRKSVQIKKSASFCISDIGQRLTSPSEKQLKSTESATDTDHVHLDRCPSRILPSPRSLVQGSNQSKLVFLNCNSAPMYENEEHSSKQNHEAVRRSRSEIPAWLHFQSAKAQSGDSISFRGNHSAISAAIGPNSSPYRRGAAPGACRKNSKTARKTFTKSGGKNSSRFLGISSSSSSSSSSRSKENLMIDAANQKPVLKALCVPVMRRHAGDYFGAECLLETNSSFHDMPLSKWSNALKFALENNACARKGKSTIDNPERRNDKMASVARSFIYARDARRLEAQPLKCAPQMSTVAHSYTDCYELHRSQFYEVLRGFPSSAAVIKRELQKSCSSESRRIKAVVQNIARIHFSKQFARRVKYNNDFDCFRYATAMEDDFCKLALYPEAVSTVARRSMRRGGSQLLDEAYGGLRRSAMRRQHSMSIHTTLTSPTVVSGDSVFARQRKKLHVMDTGALKGVSHASGPSRCEFFAGSAHSNPAAGTRKLISVSGQRVSRIFFTNEKSPTAIAQRVRKNLKSSYLSTRQSINEIRSSATKREIRYTQKIKENSSDQFDRLILQEIEFCIRRSFCDPESIASIWWNGVMVVAVLYQVVSTPLHVAFLPRNYVRYLMDWLLDILCVADVFLRTCIIGYMNHGRLIVDQKSIMKNQWKSGRLPFDIFVSLPYDLLALVVPYCLTSIKHKMEWKFCILALSRIPKFLRVIRLNDLMYAARSLSGAIEARIGNRTATLMRLLGSVLFVSHVTACVFFGLARYSSIIEPSSDKNLWECTWIRAQISNGYLRLKSGYSIHDQSSQYLRALNWALPTLVVVVIGDVTPSTCKESLFAFLTIALGMSVNAMIIGQVAAIVANSDASSTELSMKADRLEKYLQQHKVPYNLRCRINSFMSSLEMTSESHDPITGTVSGKALAESSLPHTLRARVCLAIRLPVLKRCPIFEPCPQVLKKAIALYLTPEIYSAGDLVVEYGDRGEAMYFLVRGTVQVVAENHSTIYATLKAGSFFGEGALFSNVRRMASIKCTGFSESLRLARIDVQNQLRAFCSDQQLLIEKFNTITKRNKERNAAIQNNLQRARIPGSRLYRIIQYIHTDNNVDDTSSPIQTTGRLSSSGSHALSFKEVGTYVAQLLLAEESNLRAVWNLALASLSLYTAVVAPYRAVFTKPSALLCVVPNYIWADYFCDILFLLSILLRLLIDDLISMLNDDDLKPHDSNSSSTENSEHSSHIKYINSLFFKVDCSAEIPVEFLILFFTRRWSKIYVAISTGQVDYLYEAFFFTDRRIRNLMLSARLNRILRLVRLRKYFDESTRYATLRYGLRVSVADKALATVVLAYWLCNHWYACMWFAIHRYYEADLHQTWATADGLALRTDKNIEDDERVCRISVIDCYLRSAHLVITTISSVGYGDIQPQTPIETVWQLIVVTTGACLFASLIGAFTLFLEEIDTEGWSAFRAKIQRYEAYMRRSCFPIELRTAIVQHHHHRFSKSLCINEKILTKELTAPLRMDLVLYIHRKAFQSIRILSLLPTSTTRRLADVLKIEMCLQNNYVYKAGEVNFDVYFIFSGIVHLIPPNDASILDAEGREVFKRTARAEKKKFEKDEAPPPSQMHNLPAVIYHPSEQIRKQTSPFTKPSESPQPTINRQTFDTACTAASSRNPSTPLQSPEKEYRDITAINVAAHCDRHRSRSTLISRATIGKLQQRAEDSIALSIKGFSELIERDKQDKMAQSGEMYTPVRGILRQGDHFGEYCLHFDSGICQESALAIAPLELYTVSRRDLEDQVINFESDDTLQLINDLLQIHPTHSSSSLIHSNVLQATAPSSSFCLS